MNKIYGVILKQDLIILQECFYKYGEKFNDNF